MQRAPLLLAHAQPPSGKMTARGGRRAETRPCYRKAGGYNTICCKAFWGGDHIRWIKYGCCSQWGYSHAHVLPKKQGARGKYKGTREKKKDTNHVPSAEASATLQAMFGMLWMGPTRGVSVYLCCARAEAHPHHMHRCGWQERQKFARCQDLALESASPRGTSHPAHVCCLKTGQVRSKPLQQEQQQQQQQQQRRQ